MRSIAIINQKGGCGKTTVSINLAASLAAKGQRTLLLDMDPQAHCALGLAVPETQIEHSITDLLRRGLDGSLSISEVTWQIARNLDLVPSTMALAGLEQQLSTASDRDRRLAQVLSPVQDDYDFCVIDCPPAIGLLTFNALRAADEVLIPVETGYYAMQGSIRQEQTINMLARRAGHEVRFKVLATMYDVRTKLAREILGELRRQFGDKLLPVLINFSSKLKEAASFGQPITEYDAASRGMQDFERLAAWLLANPPVRADALAGSRVVGTTPGMTRAAELAERARALTARTADLTARLADDPELGSPRVAPAPAAGSTATVAAAPTQRLDRLYGARFTAQGLLFVQPVGDAHRIAVMGDFNDWDAGRTPLTRDAQLGVWQACVPVPPGRYRYRLVVDGQAMADPHNKRVEMGEDGQPHNVVELGLERQAR
ncbi:MAG: AAA family ATPase [Phycisphaeraceae bacterium]